MVSYIHHCSYGEGPPDTLLGMWWALSKYQCHLYLPLALYSLLMLVLNFGFLLRNLVCHSSHFSFFLYHF